MKKYLPVFGIIWLTALACFAWGAAMVYYDVFPSRLLKPPFKQIIAFWKGHPADERSLAQRLRAELTADPLAFTLKPSPFPIELRFRPVDTSSYRGPAIQFPENARYYSDTDRTEKEYFLIYGGFAFEDAIWGAILISTEGQVLRGWAIKPQKPGPTDGQIGLALSATGDLATNATGVLTSYSWCGGKNWEAEWEEKPVQYRVVFPQYGYHHDITYHQGRFYTFLGPEIVSVDENTGDILERIHAADLIRWARDQDLAIFDARFKMWIEMGFKGLTKDNLVDMTVTDPFHLNKVDVLSRELADSFDDFEEGDLLVSVRSLNLIFVLRPKTSEILWYRYGLTSLQHDATFQRGYVAVFDNNPFANSGPSPRIVTLGVKDHSRSTLFDLRTWGVAMRQRGNFEFDDDSRLLAVSDNSNGRALVGHLSGKPTFIFENRAKPGQNLPVSNILQVPSQKVEAWSSRCN